MKWKAIKVAHNGYDKYIRGYMGEFLKWKFEPSKEGDYFYIEAATDNAKIEFYNASYHLYNNSKKIEYSYNKIKWYSLSTIKTKGGYIELDNECDRIYFRNIVGSISIKSSNQYPLIGNGSESTQIRIGGDLHTIMFKYTDKIETLPKYAFSFLFNNCTCLIDASDLILPATSIDYRTYYQMFRNCSNLVYSPKELCAVNLLDEDCCTLMFQNCYSLKTAPELPATNLTDGCYTEMFKNCSSLTEAPILPAAIVPKYAYNSMFLYCSSLNKVVCLATDVSAVNSTYTWLYGVSPTGTFYKHPDMNWTIGNNGIPSGWEVIDYTE